MFENFWPEQTSAKTGGFVEGIFDLKKFHLNANTNTYDFFFKDGSAKKLRQSLLIEATAKTNRKPIRLIKHHSPSTYFSLSASKL